MLSGINRLFRKERLLAPLYASFLVLVALVVLQGCLSVLLEKWDQRLADEVTRGLLIERQTERLLSAALDEQTSLRGYLITDDIAFLEPYRTRARSTFYDSLSQLQVLVQNNPAQRQTLQQIKKIYDNWQVHFADKVLNRTASRATLPGKILFDPMRPLVSEILESEELAIRQLQQKGQQLRQLKSFMNLFSVALIVAGVGWNLWLLRQRVEQPLRRLTEVGQAWRQGHLEVRLNYAAADELGRLAAVLDAMAREIRDRQERHQQRNQQLEDLISALSHDLRTPLLATRTTLRPMINGAFGPVSDTWREVLQEYHQSNENLLRLVETLLDVSRYEAGGSKNLSCEPLNWDRLLRQAMRQVAASHQTDLHLLKLQVDTALPPVYGDSVEIQRVVQNLLDNAVRVSGAEQPIAVTVAAFNQTEIKVSICDRGPGIDPQEQERLFHRFIQGRGRRGGVGLGLYLCRQIIEAHGGTIGVSSQPGEGSIFWFKLPVVSAQAMQQ